jgi:hypothetical protein
VKGAWAQHLFLDLNKYQEAIDILEGLNASPLDIIELYPDFNGEGDTDYQSKDEGSKIDNLCFKLLKC